ncbi:MAG TPA: metal ABC transporter ATP-binding protein [Chloroflexus aurantiacus]|jgi:ABC-type Mn2+/Zn2+ transport system ATPase subunit|uniref:ABC transporter related n=1 Tax=Chloroflexus aurantiacus (strain ATCC 29366 / DSM 635 / J-10-fl) TaxID=324602 RepID=A9WEE7_CHLAA|nr:MULTISPECIES: metal ABC transporter ATP-binding protein [Chloroflexus]ABY35209.1 ABC transporter related [Chloroflexus aurantiacus J-10-fl]RMG53296.1 MAG: metal ABC transporter ATP-binding protein [Chloroflexota bacterium]GIV92391.1 MAG: ABC transporter [Chloroflexus sp.]HBW68618.1 metal ABC transporter ATP-binding protein [Chloroflexus aurantiacus]
MTASSVIAPTVADPVTTVPALDIRHLTVHYRQNEALHDVSVTINVGEQVAIVGPNGAGKSTLLKAIAGLQPITSGEIRYFGQERVAPNEIAYVPQRLQIDWRFPVSVSDVVLMGRVGRIGLFRRPSQHDRQLAQRALERVGLAAFANRQIGQLSGGQQQRVFLARALAQEARLLLMDEPLVGLDIPSQDEIFRTLATLRQEGVTVLTALHDLQQAARYFDRVMLLNRSLIACAPARAAFTAAHLVATYGGHLHLLQSGDGLLTVADSCCNPDPDGGL